MNWINAGLMTGMFFANMLVYKYFYGKDWFDSIGSAFTAVLLFILFWWIYKKIDKKEEKES